MKYALLSALILGMTTTALPCYAQFSSFQSGSDGCSNFCVKLDLGSSNNDSYFGGFNSGFNNSFNNSGSNGVRWQIGITWRPTATESLAESERSKRQLEDNRSLMIALAEAISQNKSEMAHGLAILLAPRLGYGDPRKLLADLNQGSMNVGTAKIQFRPGTTTTAPALQIQPGTTNTAPALQIQPRTTTTAPAPTNPPATIIELR